MAIISDDAASGTLYHHSCSFNLIFESAFIDPPERRTWTQRPAPSLALVGDDAAPGASEEETLQHFDDVYLEAKARI